MRLSRRNFVGRTACGCALLGAGAHAQARVQPSSMQPLVSAGYKPLDIDERGLWQAFDEFEQKLASSNLLVRDAALTSYVGGIVRKLLGERAAELRLYVVRDPEFNASMAPNGMMMVNTGLIARLRNEAQLAAVLGHESGHYLRRHSVRSWRNLKSKTAAMAVISVAVGDIGIAVNSLVALSLFSFSREMESEADAYGLKLLKESGYAPHAAADVWAQLIGERKASAAVRKKRYTDRSRSVVSTHPPSEERMTDLALSARELGGVGDLGRQQWLETIRPYRLMLLGDLISLNDPGASQHLLASLAEDGWDGVLRYYEGESYRLRGEAGDDVSAAASYAEAIKFADAPAEAFRAHGYAQIKAGKGDEGRRALQRYLEMKPDASDAAMIRFSLGQ
jgi:beta-barrel assembly-enhancing protease